MKSLLTVMCTAILFCSACTKVAVAPPATATSKVMSGSLVQEAENLGSPLKGTNVSWLINPLYPNIKPLLTYTPNSTTGYVALMIDNGLLNGATPVNAFRFVAADLQTRTANIIPVKSTSGETVQTSLGRVTRLAFGMNKKLYVATEAGQGGGGHLIEYDPNTQTATDLGRPFFAKGKYLDIYMLNVGQDGALYGGSFGDNGEVYTFRYNYTQPMYVDKQPVSNDARYVAYVTGNDKFTYAAVGQNTWKLYAINRATGERTLMMTYSNPDDRIELASHADACYAKKGAVHYKLTETTTTAMNNRPLTPRVYYSPYEGENVNLPEVTWNSSEKKLLFKLANAYQNSIHIGGVTEDVYPTASMIGTSNTLFVSAAKVSELVSYSRNNGFKYLGNYAITAHTMAVAGQPSHPTLYMGGYPKGAVMEYNVNQQWTVNNLVPGYTPPAITTNQSNPQKITQFQDADAAGVRGSMYLSGMYYTKNGYLVAGGNNDRITGSAGRELSIGSLKNGLKRNVFLPEFANYEFSGMCLSKDSTLAYIAAQSMVGTSGRIYVYDAATNSIKNYFDFPLGSCPGTISLYGDNMIAGVCGNEVYLYDLNKKSIVFRQQLGNGHRIFSLAIAPDGSLWINQTGSNVFSTKVVRLQIKQEGNLLTASTTQVANVFDAHRDENTKPNLMTFIENGSGNYDLYISGLKSLYRVNNCSSI